MTIAIAVLAATIVEAATESRVALVIGNARYPDAPLKNPANDARAMAATLRERGFEVILRVDANKQQMESAVIEFGEKLSEGATGLFFFAGHGMQVQGRNFLVPTDAKLTTEQRVKVETLDVEVVLDQMQGARSKVNVVILDACRNNPFERRFRSANGGLAQINAPEGTLIAYATAPGRVAADGDGANGLYTTELLKALRAPGLKVEDVFKQMRINVARASNGGQTPWEASSLIGDFYFIPPAPVTAPAQLNAAEVEFWNSIRTTSDPGEYRAYLSRFPKGEFTDLAQMRIASLEKARLDAVERARTESAERARTEAAEKARLETERARQEAAERLRAEIERTRLAAAAVPPATAAVPPAAPPKPVQPAALPSPSSPVSGFGGIYNAKFVMIGQNGFYNIDATIEVNGAGDILGKASPTAPGPDACVISGGLDPVTGSIGSMSMTCRWLSVYFRGRFVADAQTGRVEGQTEGRALSDGRVVPIVWRP